MINILIPMAGAGSRFAKAGYEKPKPFIDVFGMPMIKHVVDNIGIDGQYIFIVQEQHLKEYPYMKKQLMNLKSNVQIVAIDELTEGAACTCLLAKDLINNNDPLLICNSDQWVDWDPNHFIKFVRSKKAAGAIPYFLSDSPKHSYSKIDFDKGVITRVAEKQVISNFATVGIYYWAKGSQFVDCAETMVSNNVRLNGEFYICPVYNILIRRGKVIPYPVYEMRGMGTPEELEKFKALWKGDGNI